MARFRTTASITDFPGVVGDGVNDDTTGIQAAINSGVSRLYVPTAPVSYRTTAPIIINSAIHISGDSTAPFLSGGPGSGIGAGSWFKLDHAGKGFVVNNGGGSVFLTGVKIDGIGTYRIHTNTITTGWTPTVSDFDFYITNSDIVIDDLCMLNAYSGLAITAQNGRAFLNNIRGQWMSTGFQFTDVYDIIRLSNVHQWPFWSNTSFVTGWQQANLTTLYTTRCDNPMLHNIFSIFGVIGWNILGDVNGTTTAIQADNLQFDSHTIGITVDPTSSGCTGQFSNLLIVGPNPPIAAATNGFYVGGPHSRIEVQNIYGYTINQILLSIAGTDSLVRMGGVRVNGWGTYNGTSPMFSIGAGELDISGIVNTLGTTGSFSSNFLTLSGAGIFRYPDYVAQGVANFGAGATSVTVNHSMPTIPANFQILLTAGSNLGAAKAFWVSNITSTQMTISLDVAPGGAGCIIIFRVCLA